jgi:plasmid stability protein
VPSITVRHVPDETRDVLAARAAAAGWSLQEYLLHELVELARRPDTRSFVAAVRQRKAAVPTSVPASEILRALAEDRA